jgi:hypothetical protein
MSHKTGEVYGVHFTGPFSGRNYKWHASINVQALTAMCSNSLTKAAYSYVKKITISLSKTSRYIEEQMCSCIHS